MILNPRFPPEFRAPPTRNRPEDLRIPEEETTAVVDAPPRWSEPEDNELRERVAAGEGPTSIGRRMGRTRNSIIGRMKRLGIKRERVA